MTNDLAIKILMGDVLGTTEQTHEAVAMAVKALSALTSADAVEVVRCKDCKHCGYSASHNQYWCGGKQVFAEHFCSRGELKDGRLN